MKLQCSCGAKYSFEVTPEMAKQPVHFSCTACGMDYSEFVTNLVRQEAGSAPAPAIAPPPPGYVPPPRPGTGGASVPASHSSVPTPPAMAPPPALAPAIAPIGSVRVPTTPAVGQPSQPPIRIPTIAAGNGGSPVPNGGSTAPAPAAVDAPAPTRIVIPPKAIAAVGASARTRSRAGSAKAASRGLSLIRSPPAAAPVAAPVLAAATVPKPAPAAGLRINKEMAAPAQVEASQTSADPDAPKPCFRHMGQFSVEKCCVCGKPICPKCMELFGYVCSPLCKSKAEAQGIEVPLFEGQRDVKEARAWRKTVLVTTAACAMVAVLVGGYIWWIAFGSRPHTVFSVRFGDRAHSGQSAFAGQYQIVFLHGGTLARHDMKQNKEIWSVNLIDEKDIDRQIAREMEAAKKEIDRANNESPEFVPKMPRPDKLKKLLIRETAASMRLRIVGQNVWVMTPEKLTRYDWDTGKTNKEIALKEHWGDMLRRGDELLALESENGKQSVTRINLNTCDVRSEDIVLPPRPSSTAKTNRALAKAAPQKKAAGTQKSAGGGLPVTPGKNPGKQPLDSFQGGRASFSHLSLPAKIALPAVLANTVNQDRTLDELNADDGALRKLGDPDDPASEYFVLIPTKDGFMQFSSHLLERKFVARSAMKAAPQKSTLENNASVANTTEIANEMLNEMQRNNGGGSVTEDESRYLIKIQYPGGSNSWSGEITGPPKLFPFKTVTVLTSNKKVTVFDKSNRKLWEGTLNYNVLGGGGGADEESATTGEGPCVEHKDTLFVFDQGVLHAFDLKTGNARWRLPSVGISGIFFDEKDNLYVNTTDASPDSIKYSRQIDVPGKVASVIQKVDSQTGKVLWISRPGGAISYVWGRSFTQSNPIARMKTTTTRKTLTQSRPALKHRHTFAFAASIPRTAKRCGNIFSNAPRWMSSSTRMQSALSSGKRSRFCALRVSNSPFIPSSSPQPPKAAAVL